MTAEVKRYSFGVRLRELRRDKGLSQQQLSDRCYGEVTKSNISRLETHLGQRPTLAVVEVLSKALDWPIDDARQRAGYAPTEVDWSLVTASELVYVLENYPLLSEAHRRFVRDHIGALIQFLLAPDEDTGPGNEQQVQTTPDGEFRRIELDDLPKRRGPKKKNGESNSG
jgi:transcriptional regulator with XRE-family HTH domain